MTERAHRPKGSPSLTPAPTGVLQRKCACGGSADRNGDCEECRAKMNLQRKAAAPREQDTIPPVVQEVLRSPGQPLDPTTRAFFEPRFSHDFSRVRVHADAQAAESARAVNALAYTVGRDVVFGQEQRGPHTSPGKHLLAHELAHVAQQDATPVGLADLTVGPAHAREEAEADRAAEAVASGATASPLASDGQVLRRQGGGGSAAPGAAPAANAWAGCAPGKVDDLNLELAEATRWVQDAITDLQSADRPRGTTNALFRYLSVDPPNVQNTILPKLELILADLQLGTSNFRCQTQAQCLGVHPGGAVAYAGRPITLCPPYFEEGFPDRVTTLVHEAGHNAGLAGNVVEWQWPFAGLSAAERLGNTESYAAFVRSNAHPALPPLEQRFGVSVGTGGLVPSGEAPRFLVTAEFDAVLAQRVFRFFDLRGGLRVDVDSSGSVIGSLSVGTRLFSPTYLTAVPTFIDLRGGFAEGVLAGFPQFTPVIGPTVEARVGILPANWGVSVGYRQIWNLVRDQPDVRELTIAGEIRF